MNELKLKVFRMNETDHFADYSKEDAIKNYKILCGIEDDEILEDEIDELTEEQLKKEILIFIDEPGQPEVTFFDHLQTFSKPGLFSSSEY